MARTMIASGSGMTDGQIDNAVNKLRAAMLKNRNSIGRGVAQEILGMSNVGMILFETFREAAEARDGLISRQVRVNRNRTPQEMLDATGFNQCGYIDFIETMPRGEGDEVEVVFFQPKAWECDRDGNLMQALDLEKALARRGLVRADPYSVAAVYEADSDFIDNKAVIVHWDTTLSERSPSACFYSSEGNRKVRLSNFCSHGGIRQWCAGIRHKGKL